MEVYTTKSKFRRKQHTKIRYYDRTNMVHSIDQIKSEIQKKGDNIYFAKRLTQNKSLIYVDIDKIIYKLIWSRDKKIINTFLPMKYDFKYSDVIFIDNDAFSVTIFPDCYSETDRKEALTKIINVRTQTDIMYNHPLFDLIFNKTMDAFNLFKEDQYA